MMKKQALILPLLLLAGCANLNSKHVISSHETYNDAVQLTVSREVLKNIVRTRYADPTQFITISSINSSFSLSTGSNASGVVNELSAATLGGNIGFSAAPTITFTPLNDNSHYKGLDTPIDLQEAVSQFNNWSQHQVSDIGFVLSAINQSADRAGQQGNDFVKKLEALHGLFMSGAVLQHVREYYPRHVAMDKEKLAPLAYTLAAKNDLYFIAEGDDKVNIATKHMAIALVLPRPFSREVEQHLATLNLSLAQGENTIYLRTPDEMDPVGGNLSSNTLWIVPRSVEGMLELASLTVDIPQAHINKGLAPNAAQVVRSQVSLPMAIKVAESQPESVYRIQHRGFWYYVDDADHGSKKMLATLVSAYSSRLDSKSKQDDTPQIVLPVGG